jgi:hypothetical protein
VAGARAAGAAGWYGSSGVLQEGGGPQHAQGPEYLSHSRHAQARKRQERFKEKPSSRRITLYLTIEPR